ncbi:unnamed protein product [Withania somnifera]
MTWCSQSTSETALPIISSSSEENNVMITTKTRFITCPSCGHTIQLQHQRGILHDMPGLPAGVKFDPSDGEILEHLEAKVLSHTHKIHPLIDDFILTVDCENGICYTHPQKLPGVSKDGQVRHFFHRPSKAYTTGTRKRRKVHTEVGGETRWHKTGKTRPVYIGGVLKGYKKILVLYTNYGRQRKPEKTNWVMHQYHLGESEEEKDGELVVSRVFYQTQPRQCGSLSIKKPLDNNPVLKTTNFVDYHPPFISYNVESLNRDSSPQLIQNLAVHGDSSSFVIPSEANKQK